MATDVDEVLDLVRTLPEAKQLAVLQTLARSLGASFSPLVAASASFWEPHSIEELAAEQNTPDAGSIEALTMPEWPKDETADDVIAYIRAQRDANRAD
ncbi:MAG TPA: hypothetical protein VKT52_04125 [Ktedonobacterales bacterium]|nr:hypothetical protein [Ktedonobacterales bacterium]